MFVRCVAFVLFAAVGSAVSAQQVQASLDQLAATPMVTVQISEQLRAPPDQAILTASTEAREPTAAAALASDKVKTERLLAAIHGAGIESKDVQTQGVSVSADYDYVPVNGRGVRRLNGYVARNTVRIKTRNIDRLVGLLDTLTAAGASDVYGPQFTIAEPAPLRAEARRRAMARGEAEASEYARNAGFARVRLLSVQEGVSYHAADIIVTGSRVGAPPPPPAPAAAAPERDSIEPGQIETGVTVTLQYRMEH